MAFVRLMCKAAKIEKLRKELGEEKKKSFEASQGKKPKFNAKQKYRHFWLDLQSKIGKWFKRKCTFPKNSCMYRTAYKLKRDGTCENFTLKSVVGFISGFFLTYIFFMFFVFILNFKLSTATIMCSFFGSILTIGLAFSYKVRCVVFLLLPQFFSKRGRQALMAYAFILAITGPAKNTLHNMGILSESLACGQEQLKAAVRQIIEMVKKPFYAIRDAIKTVVKTVKVIVKKIKEVLLTIKRVIMAILRVIKAAFQFLGKILSICNKELGTPFERCSRVFENAIADCNAKLGPLFSWLCSITYLVKTVCYIVKIFDFICIIIDFISDSVIGVVVRKVKIFVRHIRTMFYVRIKFSHSFHFETNQSKSMSEITSGIVTEIRQRTENILAVFDFMSCATSFFFLFIILRVMHYRYKFLTNERFDNRFITKDLRDIDMRRAQQEKETILPLNHRERSLYITVTSIRLVKSEKVKLSKAAVVLGMTTLKLSTHMMADYALYWVLTVIRYHARFQSTVQAPNIVGLHVEGKGFLANLLRSIVKAFQPLGVNLEIDTVPCLPDPIPPDFDRYIQIASLLVLCWILTIFEPYGLRLRHSVMCFYHPTRARQRAVWLYNHIMRSRSFFLKFARRQLRRKITGGKGITKITFKEYLRANIKFKWLRLCLGSDKQDACLLCGEVFRESDPVKPIRCIKPGCPGIYCEQCFADLQNLCTVCMEPIQYGDLSDISEEKDSSDDAAPPTKKKSKKRKKRCTISKCLKKKRDRDSDDEADGLLSQSGDSDESEQSDSDYYSSGSTTDNSYSYQYGKDITGEAQQGSISKFSDVEKQEIPDYASWDTFVKEGLSEKHTSPVKPESNSDSEESEEITLKVEPDSDGSSEVSVDSISKPVSNSKGNLEALEKFTSKAEPGKEDDSSLSTSHSSVLSELQLKGTSMQTSKLKAKDGLKETPEKPYKEIITGSQGNETVSPKKPAKRFKIRCKRFNKKRQKNDDFEKTSKLRIGNLQHGEELTTLKTPTKTLDGPYETTSDVHPKSEFISPKMLTKTVEPPDERQEKSSKDISSKQLATTFKQPLKDIYEKQQKASKRRVRPKETSPKSHAVPYNKTNKQQKTDYRMSSKKPVTTKLPSSASRSRAISKLEEHKLCVSREPVSKAQRKDKNGSLSEPNLPLELSKLKQGQFSKPKQRKQFSAKEKPASDESYRSFSMDSSYDSTLFKRQRKVSPETETTFIETPRSLPQQKFKSGTTSSLDSEIERCQKCGRFRPTVHVPRLNLNFDSPVSSNTSPPSVSDRFRKNVKYEIVRETPTDSYTSRSNTSGTSSHSPRSPLNVNYQIYVPRYDRFLDCTDLISITTKKKDDLTENAEGIKKTINEIKHIQRQKRIKEIAKSKNLLNPSVNRDPENTFSIFFNSNIGSTATKENVLYTGKINRMNEAHPYESQSTKPDNTEIYRQKVKDYYKEINHKQLIDNPAVTKDRNKFVKFITKIFRKAESETELSKTPKAKKILKRCDKTLSVLSPKFAESVLTTQDYSSGSHFSISTAQFSGDEFSHESSIGTSTRSSGSSLMGSTASHIRGGADYKLENSQQSTTTTRTSETTTTATSETVTDTYIQNQKDENPLSSDSEISDVDIFFGGRKGAKYQTRRSGVDKNSSEIGKPTSVKTKSQAGTSEPQMNPNTELGLSTSVEESTLRYSRQPAERDHDPYPREARPMKRFGSTPQIPSCWEFHNNNTNKAMSEQYTSSEMSPNYVENVRGRCCTCPMKPQQYFNMDMLNETYACPNLPPCCANETARGRKMTSSRLHEPSNRSRCSSEEKRRQRLAVRFPSSTETSAQAPPDYNGPWTALPKAVCCSCPLRSPKTDEIRERLPSHSAGEPRSSGTPNNEDFPSNNTVYGDNPDDNQYPHDCCTCNSFEISSANASPRRVMDDEVSCCSGCSGRTEFTDFPDLKYQNTDEFFELVNELGDTLSLRNKERVKKAMREFEIRSSQNQNLERPVFDSDSEDRSHTGRSGRYRRGQAPTCCHCLRKKHHQPCSTKFTRVDTRRENPVGDAPYPTTRYPQRSGYVENVVKHMDHNGDERPRRYPKFNKKITNTHWELNPRTGEWHKVFGDYYEYENDYYGAPSPSPASPKQTCICERSPKRYSYRNPADLRTGDYLPPPPPNCRCNNCGFLRAPSY